MQIGNPLPVALPRNVSVRYILSGAPVSDGFQVMGCTPVPAREIKLLVSTTRSDEGLFYTSSGQATVQYSNSLGGQFSQFHFTVTGLEPFTEYFYAVEIDGVLEGKWRRSKTAPTPGANVAYRFAAFSCAKVTSKATNMIACLELAARNPDFIISYGDNAYANNKVADAGQVRRRSPRVMLEHAQVQAMLDEAPVIILLDDHDSAGNDALVESYGGLGAAIFALSRQVMDEMVPHHAYADAGSSARVRAMSFTYGNTEHTCLDTRGASTMLGTPTSLGTGTNPAGSFNQLQWLKDRIDAAVLAGRSRHFIHSPRGFPRNSNYGGSWRQVASDELDDIVAYALANGGGITDFCCGDVHFSGICNDWLGSGCCLLISSPIRNNDVASLDPDDNLTWNGVPSGLYDIDRQFLVADVGTDGKWIASFYGQKVTPATTAADLEIELKASYDLRDLTP